MWHSIFVWDSFLLVFGHFFCIGDCIIIEFVLYRGTFFLMLTPKVFNEVIFFLLIKKILFGKKKKKNLK